MPFYFDFLKLALKPKLLQNIEHIIPFTIFFKYICLNFTHILLTLAIIFDNMHKKAPMNINVLLNLAKCYDKLGNAEEALKMAEEIVDTFPECEDAQELIRKLS